MLGPFLAPAAEWLISKIGWIPLFSRDVDPKGSVFVAAVVLAIMILPIVTAISRDVFAQTPRDHIEAALALGATRWEVIRTAVLPYGRSGVISASMLGLGRALGETIAVMIILTTPAPGSPFSPSIFAGGETFASKIANNAAEFDSPSKTGAYIAAGLVLFVVTFAVNAMARIIADRGERSHDRHDDHRPPHARSRSAGPSGARTVKNALATVYVDHRHGARGHPAGLGALHRDQQGRPAHPHLRLVAAEPARHHPAAGGRRGLPRHRRHRRDGADLRGDRRPAGHPGRDLPDRVRQGTKVARAVSFTVDILSGIPSIVAALFIYALFITIFGLRPLRRSRCRWPWCC